MKSTIQKINDSSNPDFGKTAFNEIKKLLFIICLFTGTAGFAQDSKPTKEETIAFINRTINECKGFELPWGYGTLNSVEFQERQMVINTSAYFSKERLYDVTETCEDFRWDKLDTASLKLKETEGVFYYNLGFTSNYKCTTRNHNYNPKLTQKDETKSQFKSGYLPIFIPEKKSESIKKAVLRLVEIAKEENRDPFAE